MLDFDFIRIEPESSYRSHLRGRRIRSTTSLREQILERLIDFHQAHVTHRLGPETRIQQVQDRVFNTADVLIHRHPIIVALIDHGLRIRTGIARTKSESTKVSMVSVSRWAGLPHSGKAHSRNRHGFFNGLPEPSGIHSVGNTTGKSS